MRQISRKYLIMLISMFCLISISSCKKFLDEKSDKKLVIPSTLTDLQALLDYLNTMVNGDPYVAELSSDNFYLPTSAWQTLVDYDRNIYTWQKDNIYEPTFNDWSILYRKVYTANSVLESLKKIDKNITNSNEWNNIKGQALMVRGKSFLYAVSIWSQAYDSATANKDMGIPLRLSTDFSETSTRPTLQATYDQIISDLIESTSLLPNRGIHPIRPCRAAAFGLLARTYLSMRNYIKTGIYADSSLKINGTLLDYNTLNAAVTYPIPQFNTETNYYTVTTNTAFTSSYGKIDSILYASYSSNDCRKTIFFNLNADGSASFRGSYVGASASFMGLASDEVYLTRAEAYARAGNTTAALADLNTLLLKRWKTGTFIPVTATDANNSLMKILIERRKELLFRGLRWMDIKRLNKEGANITLKRVVNNIAYTLLPNDLGFALPIPEYVISLTGMPQNPR